MTNLIKYYWCKWFHKEHHIGLAYNLGEGKYLYTTRCSKIGCTAKQMVWI
jgi:hypothetical protein